MNASGSMLEILYAAVNVSANANTECGCGAQTKTRSSKTYTQQALTLSASPWTTSSCDRTVSDRRHDRVRGELGETTTYREVSRPVLVIIREEMFALCIK